MISSTVKVKAGGFFIAIGIQLNAILIRIRTSLPGGNGYIISRNKFLFKLLRIDWRTIGSRLLGLCPWFNCLA
jgi:hypothetical protein